MTVTISSKEAGAARIAIEGELDTMTVGENIILGAEGRNQASIDWGKANKDILNLSNELRLGVSPKARRRAARRVRRGPVYAAPCR